MKGFKPRITEIKHIGDELRFQRYYYNYKNNRNIVLKYESKNESNCEKLDDVLLDFMNSKFGDITESCASYDNLYAIENNKARKKKDKYNPNTYYLRIYSLFKLYGFLDDYEIFRLLERNGITPNFKDSKLIARGLITACEEEYQFNGEKKHFDMNSCRISVSFFTMDLILRQQEELKFYSKKEYLEKCQQERKDAAVFFSRFKKEFKEKLLSLNDVERKIISLEMGKTSDFVDNYLNGKGYSLLTCGSILNFLELFDLEKTDLYIALLHTSPAFLWKLYKDMIPHTHFLRLNKDFE